MVRHDNKLMQQVFLLCSVMQQDFNKQTGNFLNLEKAPFLEDIGSDKIAGFSCCSSMRNGQRSPQRLKPRMIAAYRRPKGLLHPLEPESNFDACCHVALSRALIRVW
jgi:hypothetical protein